MKDNKDDFTEPEPHSFVSATPMDSFEDNCAIPKKGGLNADDLQGFDRFFTRGKYTSKLGLFSLGHVGVVHGLNDGDMTPWMDDHAVRIRAGIMNIFSWISFMNIMFVKGTNFFVSVRELHSYFFTHFRQFLTFHFSPLLKDPSYAWTLMLIASWEFISSSLFGLTPIAPVGCLATLISMKLYKEPLWTPAGPKRFSWLLGLCVVVTCLGLWRYADSIGEVEKYSPYLKGLALTCVILTWSEAACGFCLGCYMYNGFRFISPEDAQQEACAVCQVRITNKHESALGVSTKSVPV